MDKHSIAKALIAELSARLVDLEALEAFVAAAHLAAAIEALGRDFDLSEDASVTD